MKNAPLRLFFLLFLFIFLPSSFYLFSGEELSPLQRAYENYTLGQKTTDAALKRKAFNEALELYQQAIPKKGEGAGLGKLYDNIGNIYFQLGEYPWAILYYYRALKLFPEDERIQSHLRRAQEILGITTHPQKTLEKRAFFFPLDLPTEKTWQWLYGLWCAIFFVGSLWIWRPRIYLKGIFLFLLIIWSFLLGSIGVSDYLSPVEGVFIEPSFFYRKANREGENIFEEPFLPGEKITVLGTEKKGHWLRVVTDRGMIGYVAYDSIRLI